LSGVADEKIAPYIGVTQYFFTDFLQQAIKNHFSKGDTE